MAGRKPMIAAPEGHRGCPACKRVLPLVHPDTGEQNFARSGYCTPCAHSRVAAYKRAKTAEQAVARGVAPPDELKAESIRAARIAPFPAIKPFPRCSCCRGTPQQQVHGLDFCDRCAYYVAACGRCADHSFREFIPELRGNPDPPPLPYVPPPLPIITRRSPDGVRGRDELDLPPELRK